MAVESGRHLDLDAHVEIPLAAGRRESRDAFAPETEDRAALGADGDLDRRLAVQRGNLQLTTEGCDAEGKGHLAEKVIAITLEDSGLKLQATGQPKAALRQDAATEFTVVGAPARIVFVMDEPTGKATSLVLHQGGREMTAKKQ